MHGNQTGQINPRPRADILLIKFSYSSKCKVLLLEFSVKLNYWFLVSFLLIFSKYGMKTDSSLFLYYSSWLTVLLWNRLLSIHKHWQCLSCAKKFQRSIEILWESTVDSTRFYDAYQFMHWHNLPLYYMGPSRTRSLFWSAEKHGKSSSHIRSNRRSMCQLCKRVRQANTSYKGICCSCAVL